MYSILKKQEGLRDFAKSLNQQRAKVTNISYSNSKNMCIPTINFKLFCDLMEVAINEANRVKDIHSCTILINMSATFYRNVSGVTEFVQYR